jgi:hypothetical protein
MKGSESWDAHTLIGGDLNRATEGSNSTHSFSYFTWAFGKHTDRMYVVAAFVQYRHQRQWDAMVGEGGFDAMRLICCWWEESSRILPSGTDFS